MEASSGVIRDDIRRTQEALATCDEGAMRPLLERQLVELVALLARRSEEEENAVTEQEINAERVERLAGLVRALEALADEMEGEQRFSDAHRLNEAVACVVAVQRTLEGEGR